MVQHFLGLFLLVNVFFKVFGQVLSAAPPVDFVPAKVMEQGTWRGVQ